MNPLSGLASINAVVRGAANLVRELKQPRLKSEDFASVLKAQMNQGPPSTQQTQEARLQAALVQSSRIMHSRDMNLDGLLSTEESGLEPELFTKLDIDGDLRLSQEELKAGYLAAFEGRGPALPIQEKI